MIPLRTMTPPETTPVVTRALLTLHLVIFAAQWLSGPRGETLVRLFGFIPARLFDPSSFGISWPEAVLTLVSSLLLHGGFVHLFGNLLYLWIFGPNVESKLGHIRFVIFYILCGVAGSLTHAMLYSNSRVPSIGASGCIAGILGAFLVLYPRERIVTLIPFVVSWTMMEVPTLVLLPLWFLIQFLNGFMTLASTAGTQETAAVAWWAHIGGFLFGVLATLLARRLQSRR